MAYKIVEIQEEEYIEENIESTKDNENEISKNSDQNINESEITEN